MTRVFFTFSCRADSSRHQDVCSLADGPAVGSVEIHVMVSVRKNTGQADTWWCNSRVSYQFPLDIKHLIKFYIFALTNTNISILTTLVITCTSETLIILSAQAKTLHKSTPFLLLKYARFADFAVKFMKCFEVVWTFSSYGIKNTRHNKYAIHINKKKVHSEPEFQDTKINWTYKIFGNLFSVNIPGAPQTVFIAFSWEDKSSSSSLWAVGKICRTEKWLPVQKSHLKTDFIIDWEFCFILIPHENHM